MMKVVKKDLESVLQDLAMADAADHMVQGGWHGSRVAFVNANAWQGEALKGMAGIVIANDPVSFTQHMQSPETEVIFVPASAMLTREIMQDICKKSGLNKVIICEGEF